MCIGPEVTSVCVCVCVCVLHVLYNTDVSISPFQQQTQMLSDKGMCTSDHRRV